MNAIPQFKGGNRHREVSIRPYLGAKYDKATSRTIRLEMAAQEFLEDWLHRKRWTAEDRDSISEFLAEVVRREIAHEIKPNSSKGGK